LPGAVADMVTVTNKNFCHADLLSESCTTRKALPGVVH
jgi:hypothetical protein